MSSQQKKQKCQLSAKCPPKCPLQGPQAPAACLPPSGPPAPACCVSTCCISGFGGRCSLVSHRFPRFYLRQPQRSDCPENESSGCSSCGHSLWKLQLTDALPHSAFLPLLLSKMHGIL